MTTYKEKVYEFLKRHQYKRYVDVLDDAITEGLIDECGCCTGNIVLEENFCSAIQELKAEGKVVKIPNPEIPDNDWGGVTLYKVVD